MRLIRNPDPLTIFRRLTAIPQDSGDEKEVAAYLVSFAETRGLDVTVDDAYNVMIRKPAAAYSAESF